MLKQIWNPNKETLTKLKVLLMVSIPVGMLLPLVLNLLFPNYPWHSLSIFLIVGIIIVGIIVSIRFSITEGSKIKNQNHIFLKKLSGAKGNRFVKTAIGIGIFFIVIVTGILYVASLIVPLEKRLILFMAVAFLILYARCMRSIYLKLFNDDQKLL